MEGDHKLKLYSYFRSSCSWRVRIALAYKGIPYEYVPVDLAAGEQHSADFKKLNPFSTVPVLVDDGFILADSFAILEYLEEKYPLPPLFPSDIKKKALVRQVINHIVAAIQPLQNLSVLIRVEEKCGAEERVKWARHYIESGFHALEVLLQQSAGKYCFGDDFTMADVVLIPQFGNATRFEVNMDKFPVLRRIGDVAKGLEWVYKAAPENQPDARV